MINYSIIFIGFIILLLGSISDIKKREIPDFLSYSFWFIAIILNLIITVITGNIWFLINSITGMAFGFLLGLILFYTGQWGGGDTKILIGVFALLGINIQHLINLILSEISFIEYILSANWFLFLVNLGLAGGLIGVIYSTLIFIKDFKKVKKGFKELIKNKLIAKIRKRVIFFSFIVIILGIYKLIINKSSSGYFIIFFGITPYLIFFVWVLAKTIDSCMNKRISANKVTVGDWIMKEVFIKRRTKNLLVSAFEEFNMRTEKQISLKKFKELLALKYLKTKSKKLFLKIRFNKVKLHQFTEDFCGSVSCSSKTRFLKHIEKFHFHKKEVPRILKFLENEDIFFNKLHVCGFHTTGISAGQEKIIQDLYKKKKLRSVIVKIGIPFIPSFLIAFIVTFVLGFWWNFI